MEKSIVQHVGLLETLKPIPLIPEINMATVSMVAEYFGCSTTLLRLCIKENRERFVQNGMRVVSKEEFAKASGAPGNMKKGGVQCFTKECVLLFALLLKTNILALRFRDTLSQSGVDLDDLLPESDTARSSHEALTVINEQEILGKQFRMYGSVENPLFLAKDVAEWIEYTGNTGQMLENVDSNEKVRHTIYAPSFPREAWFLTEDGLYEVLMQSRKPIAKQFKRKVKEILKSIRKHGAYMTPETLKEALLSPDFLIQLAEKLKEEQEKNRRLTMTNAALTKEANEWDDRSLVIRLIRKYGSCKYENRFGFAWDEFYRTLNYKLHINLRTRLSYNGDRRKKPIDMIRDDEWKDVLRVAVAMCESVGIDTAEILSKHAA